MEVRIGVRNIARELTFESDQSSSQVQETVSAGMASGGVISLSDDHGRVLLIPSEALGYVEVGVQEKSKVGFGTA